MVIGTWSAGDICRQLSIASCVPLTTRMPSTISTNPCAATKQSRIRGAGSFATIVSTEKCMPRSSATVAPRKMSQVNMNFASSSAPKNAELKT